MLTLLQTIHDHVYESEITQSLRCIKSVIPPEQLPLPVQVVGCTKAGKVVITETLADVLAATDIGLIAERTFLLCALHKLPEDTLLRIRDVLVLSQKVSARIYEKYVNYPLAVIASEKRVMHMSELAAFPKKDELGKYLVNKLLINHSLTAEQVDQIIQLVVTNPIAYWVPQAGKILLEDIDQDGVSRIFNCKVQVEEAADLSGWPPLGWPL